MAETLEMAFEDEPCFEQCPATDCINTEDLYIQELAPGSTWAYSSSVCGHWAFIYRKGDDRRGTIPPAV